MKKIIFIFISLVTVHAHGAISWGTAHKALKKLEPQPTYGIFHPELLPGFAEKRVQKLMGIPAGANRFQLPEQRAAVKSTPFTRGRAFETRRSQIASVHRNDNDVQVTVSNADIQLY